MEQVKFLNDTVWCTLAPSKIHGIGVHALRDIKKGEKLNCWGRQDFRWFTILYSKFDELKPEIRELIEQRWPIVKDGHSFLSPNNDVRLISFMNHADNPNYDHKTDIAICAIIKGEEVTEDYGEYKHF